MAIADGYFPAEGLTRGSNKLVNIADHLEPTPMASDVQSVTNTESVMLNEYYYLQSTPEISAFGAYITVEGAPVRFSISGSEPTSGSGILVNPGGTIQLESFAEIAGFKVIATTSTNAVIQIAYWR